MLSSNKRDKNKISIILTGYNEGDVLLSSLNRIYSFLEKTKYDWELILFDDKSMDKTLDIFKKFASSHNKAKVFKHDNNIGRGGTVIDASYILTRSATLYTSNYLIVKMKAFCTGTQLVSSS